MTDDSVGYSDISFSRASPVWKCHCILAVSRLRSISHADNSHLSLSRVDIRRERHWRKSEKLEQFESHLEELAQRTGGVQRAKAKKEVMDVIVQWKKEYRRSCKV